MFVYQDNKLFVEAGGTLVGVNISPTGITLVKESTVFKNGTVLCESEVKARFGDRYTFPKKVGEKVDRRRKTDTPKNSAKRGRSSK